MPCILFCVLNTIREFIPKILKAIREFILNGFNIVNLFQTILYATRVITKFQTALNAFR